MPSSSADVTTQTSPTSPPGSTGPTDWTGCAVEIALSRDYLPDAAQVTGMSLGARRITGAWRPLVAELHRAGVRHARLPVPVDLCPDAGAASGRALVLLRELTAHAVAVDWVARCHDGCAGQGMFDHLYPPDRVVGAVGADDPAVRGWRDSFFLGKCVFRRGPGFVEVRDRRAGALELFTIDEPEHLVAIGQLLEGVPAGQVPAPVRRDLADARLIAAQAGQLWWLPTPAYRWPFPALAI
ncbi:hypothetical protein EDC02_0158 [Micromonospora sp. Llam0]|uniref:DUF5825 family protein n=1 Tax=Micromonospora sp. Llam0 TaxID=2485143 RepID=UPI000FB405A0|nr:DUF5825 family protein [Micromonospora sp. Llam0]ROO58403.1 hypothetical protein EDC02_0158 [Micromonospora sp. Llam0]